MENDIIEITDETKKKLRDFDEQEAYFLLCEIFSYAQATKDYAKFQTDLSEWKKRYPIDLFSDDYKRKIKYMLSNEFLDTVLKNFIAFDELSKKDPAQGLEKLRKIFNKAEKHKDAKTLDKDLDSLYKEYPLKFLKEKYPHIVGQLLSKAHREKVLEKFDSSLAFKELDNIVSNPDKYSSVTDFTDTISEWQKLFPIEDFKSDYQDRVQKTLAEFSDKKKLEELFPVYDELDLSSGTVIPLEFQASMQDISLVAKNALYDFFKIVDRNKGDINKLFDWTCKYSRYINGFDESTKNLIVENLMTKYGYELPPVGTQYKIPKMDSGINDLLSLSDYVSLEDSKKETVLQLLGILSTGNELSNDDIYRLNILSSNAQKAKTIETAKIEPKLDLFIEKFKEHKLTPSDNIYLGANSDTSFEISVSEDIDLTLQVTEDNDIAATEEQVHETDNTSFKEAIKVTETLKKVNTDSSTSNNSGGSNSGGGSAQSLSKSEEIFDKDISDEEEDKKESKEEINVKNIAVNTFSDITLEESSSTENIQEPIISETTIEPSEKSDINKVESTVQATIIETTDSVAEENNPEVNNSTVENTQEVNNSTDKKPHKNFTKFFSNLFNKENKDDGFDRDDR